MQHHVPWLPTRNAIWLSIIIVWCAVLMCLTSTIVQGQESNVKDSSNSHTLAVKRLDGGRCLPLPARKLYLVVEDRDSLNSLLALERPENCADFKMPEIEFDKYALLGLRVVGDCANALETRVVKDEASKEYRVTGDFAVCAGMQTGYRWQILPKLPPGFKVSIIINSYDFVTDKYDRAAP